MPFSFNDTIKKIASTALGKEASMYGPLRDIFICILGYPPSNVDIDTIGDEGRPDLTVNAPSGILNPDGTPRNGSWIVVEAKDEPGSFLDPDSRETIFAEKEKYVGPHTAWFVMVDPLCFVFRPVTGLVHTGEADIIIETSGLSESQFRTRCQPLFFELAGVSAQLERFRQGDQKMIAVDRLAPISKTPSLKESNQVRLNRKRFFEQVREATQQLQESVAMTLGRIRPEIEAFQKIANSFWEEFRKPEDIAECFDRHSLTLKGRPQGPTESKRHDREAARLRRVFARTPHIARVAISGLAEFQARTGVKDENRDELFAIETANLILARVLLLRFFEDHGFFGETRFICNGGIDAFQKMRAYFKASYAKLLEQAYEEGSQLYASAFAETELDWIFGTKDPVLSNSIEWTLFRFARYDFTTVRGDILTGIYDRFMNREQRKKLGEFYTPPSIARYIVERTGIGPHSRVFDPACGSGTFLIESYQAIVGRDLERGAADYADVLDAFDRIAGNDLNTFSAVLAQIQLLWQILQLRNAIEQEGFPDIRVTAKINSLVEHDHFAALDRFAELDVPEYDAVVGNPPYIRAERSAQALDTRSEMEFQRDRDGHKGVSPKLNSFALFLYRALDRWCRPVGLDGKGGLVAFVLPVSLFDGNETVALRSLFQIGGRWTIREIVDLEVIYRQVFDADVLPAIFIAENRPARNGDTVSVRFADQKCVSVNSSNALPEFELHSLEESLIPYNNLFSPDGRILTRLTPDRLKIVQTLRANQTFEDIAKPYWVRRDKTRIVEWVDIKPEQTGWEERRMLARGIVFRGSKHTMKSGLAVYKGENIVATELQGEAALKDADVSLADDPSLWKYKSILPELGLAVAQVAHCANALQFDPTKLAFSDTATILFPQDSLATVPLDLILLSNVYVWFYAIAARMGVLRTLRSHIYPTNLAMLPWNSKLTPAAPKIEAMRSHITSACRSRLASGEALRTALKELDLQTFKTHLRKDSGARVFWAEGLGDIEQKTLIDSPSVSGGEDKWRVTFGEGLFDWFECNRRELAEGMTLALRNRIGEDFDKSAMLNLKMPYTKAEVAMWLSVVALYQEPALEEAMRLALSDLDTVVGAALGLTPAQITFIQDDLQNDSFLRGIRPRYPGTITRKQGFRVGLDASDRYA